MYSLGVLVVLGVVGWTALVRSLGSIYCLQPTVCELNWRKTNLHKRHFLRPTLNICTELSFRKFTVKRSQKRPQNKVDSAGPSRRCARLQESGTSPGAFFLGAGFNFFGPKEAQELLTIQIFEMSQISI